MPPVIGDGLLGGNERFQSLTLGTFYTKAEIANFIITVYSCTRNEDFDPSSHWCGHIPDSSSLPTCHYQPARHTGRQCSNVCILYTATRTINLLLLWWIQKQNIFSSLSQSHQLARVVDALQQAASVCTPSVVTSASSVVTTTVSAAPAASTSSKITVCVSVDQLRIRFM